MWAKPWRLVALVLGIMLGIMLYISKDYGISGDEADMAYYGKYLLHHYFGTPKPEKKAVNPLFDKVGKLYGGFFELTATAIHYYVFPESDLYRVRHAVGAFFGWLGIMAVALIGYMFGGWRLALLSALLMFFFPRYLGHVMNNSKDGPFAGLYILSIWAMLSIIKDKFQSDWKKWLLWGVITGLAIAVRVGGLILIAYMVMAIGLYFLYLAKKQSITRETLISVGIRFLIASLVAYFLPSLFWPYASENPIINPIKALQTMSEYPVGMRVLFEGHFVWASALPWYYPLKWIVITSPLAVLLGTILAMIAVKKETNWKKYGLALLIFTAVFPVIYVIGKGSVLYDGWRHLLFIAGPMVASSAIGWFAFMNSLKRPWKVALGLTFFLLWASAVWWTIRWHPHQVVYFNEFIGYLKGAYGNYETDYYLQCTTHAVWELEKTIAQTDDTVTIISNFLPPLVHYLKDKYPHVKIKFDKYYTREQKAWNYAIWETRFIDPGLLRDGGYPPFKVVWTEKVQGVPLVAIIKNENPEVHLAFHALKEENNPIKSINAFKRALKVDIRNERIYEGLAEAFLTIGLIDSAIAILDRLNSMYPQYSSPYLTKAELYLRGGKFKKALQELQRAEQLQPHSPNVKYIKIVVLLNMGNIYLAKQELEKALKQYPDNPMFWQIRDFMAKQGLL